MVQDEKITSLEEKIGDLSTKEMFEQFRTEMMEKLANQEQRIVTQEEKSVDQDLKIARLSETIVKQEEAIAEQQKAIVEQEKIIVEQNETIQMITTHPDLLQGFQTILSKDSGDT